MSTNYAMIPRYKFVPPYPLNESDFSIAKQLQSKGSNKVKYLKIFNKNKLKRFAKLFAILYATIGVLWTFVWIVSLNLPNSGAAGLYNNDTFPTLAGYLSIGLIYVIYEILWEFFTAKGYNAKVHQMIKKSTSYSDFRAVYYNRYKK